MFKNIFGCKKLL